jgi:hypothetical protein
MAKNYSTANHMSNVADQAVGASAVETVVGQSFELTQEDSLNFKIRLKCSTAVETTAISWKLQHSWNNSDWEDVSVGAAVATVAIGGTLILADTTVGATNDIITKASHGFSTGDEIFYHCDGAGVVTGLTNNTIYYVVDIDGGTFYLATTRALAIAGTAIDLTRPTGTDGHFYTPTNSELALNVENSTDEAVLGLWPYARIVATTGALDQFTVSDMFRTRRF